MGWFGKIVDKINPFDNLLDKAISIGGDLFGANSAKKSAREQMAFQERMSSTSYQRAVKDMIAAGLNPQLAYSQGGATTPSGALADVPQQMGSRAITSASTAAANRAQILNLNANTALTAEKAEQEKMQTDSMRAKYQDPANRNNFTNLEIQEKVTGLDKLKADAERARHEAGIRDTEARMKKVEEAILEATAASTINSAKSLAAIRDKEVTAAELKNILTRLQLPEAQAMADWFEHVGESSPAMKAVMSISQWLKYILR